MWRKAVVAVSFPALLWAQSSSTVTGQVVDQTQAAVPGARVTLKSVDTGVELRTVTNKEGYYTFVSLIPGDYQLSAEFEGFKKASTEPFKVDTTATARVDLVLLPADAKQVIEVTAAPPAIETQSGAAGATVSNKEIETLPLEGRNVLELALTVPGVGGEMGGDEAGIYQNVPTAGAGLSIGGGRTSTSALLADGANATSVGIGRATVTFSQDTIQEFRVITSSYSAQYGVSGGGIISTVSRSGGDQLRGSAAWYTRNPKLAARQFNRPIPPQLRRNEFSATLGGPVLLPKLYDGRRRTFFFFAFEPKRWIDAVDVYERVPTEEERQGDFRNSYVAPGASRPLLYQQVECLPTLAQCDKLVPLHRSSATTEYPLWGLVIPKPYLDPIAQLILKDVPMPNQPYDSSGKNYFGTRGVVGTDNRWNLKIDHNISSKNRLTGRYSNIPGVSERYRAQKGNLFFMSLPSDQSVTRQFVLSNTHTVSPRIVNEFRGNYTYSDYSRTPPGDLAKRNYTKEKFGLPNVTSWGYPAFGSGFTTYGLSTGNGLGQYLEKQFQFADDVTMVFGKHTITTGTDWRFPQMNVMSTGLPDACCGTYNFSARLTNSGWANTPGGTGGMQFASFLLGVPESASLRAIVIPYYYRWRTGAAFFQDDFKIKRNLTLNLGVRWQYVSPRAEKYNRQATVDLDNPVPLTAADGKVTGYTLNYVYAGFLGSRYLEPVHKRNFEPRFGFAWSPAFGWAQQRRMVLRGGYGISHAPRTGRGRDPIPDFGIGQSGSWNYVQWVGANPRPTFQAVDPASLISIGRNPPVVRGDPIVLQIPENGKLCAGCTPRDPRVPTGNLISFIKTNDVPYVQTWSLTAQMEAARQLVVTITYMGQKGTHLYSPLINYNQPNPTLFDAMLDAGLDPTERIPDPFGRVNPNGTPMTIARQDLLRPYPTLPDINVVGFTNGLSIYHAGTVQLERRFHRGVGYRFNYSWSKSIDTNSDSSLETQPMFIWGNGRVQNALDLRGNRSVSLFDSRHRFNATTTLELPFGRKRRLLGNAGRWTNLAVGGWQLSGIWSLYSGFPFQPSLGDGNGIPGGRSGANRVRPDMVPGVPIVNPRWNKSVANDVPYFNPEAFARPPYGQLGNAPRTLDWGRNPWRLGLNTSLFKDFRPFENGRRYLQLRGDFFNVLNHTSFTTNPNSSLEMFSSGIPVSRTGLDLSGPVPYLVNQPANAFPVGTRERILAQYYQQGFGRFDRNNNGPGRVIQLSLRLYF